MRKKYLNFCTLLIAIFLAGCSTKNSIARESPSIPIQEQLSNEKISISDGAHSKILIAYFSRAGNIDLTSNTNIDATTSASINIVNKKYMGNTELLAHWIQESIGGDLFFIQTENFYPSNYDDTLNQAQQENRENARPVLTTHIENINDYDVMFLGFPTWWGDMPMAVYSFLEEYDLSGKTIIPFCTSGGSSFSNTIHTITNLQPNAKVMQNGLAIQNNNLLNAQADINKWLTSLELPQTLSEKREGVFTVNSNEKIKNEIPTINIQIGNENFKIILYDNPAVKSLLKQMPMTLNMSELNGNEKYFYLSEDLPISSEKIETIHTGDFMLYGSDCLVLFYKTFSTTYSYTKLGYIEDVTGLAEAFKNDSIQVTFTISN